MLQKTLALFAVLVTSVSFADEAVPPSILAQRIANLEARKIAKAILKVATGDSLAADASVTLRGASRIPPGSIILRTYAFIKEQAASASGNTLAFGCEATNDLVEAFVSNTPTTTDRIEGKSTGTTATSIYSDGCTLTAKIGGGGSGISDGTVYLYVEYANGN